MALPFSALRCEDLNEIAPGPPLTHMGTKDLPLSDNEGSVGRKRSLPGVAGAMGVDAERNDG